MRTAIAGVVTLVALVSQLNAASDLPKTIELALRTEYGGAGEVRYVTASTDLNGDGKPELLVYVMGASACGNGGCYTLVFTPMGGDAYRQVATISVSNPPIRVSTRTSHGWKDLIVRVAGGGAPARDAELRYNGTRYQSNPATAHKVAGTTSALVLIPETTTFETAKVLMQ